MFVTNIFLFGFVFSFCYMCVAVFIAFIFLFNNLMVIGFTGEHVLINSLK